jgi:glycosyltransferase involved in cell wall biosynthesis
MTHHTAPLVSILINNYNYEGYVGAAIESALAQTYAPVEIVVVDDGSTDGSRAVIESFGDRIRTVMQPNSGQASAFNSGFAASAGQIICLLDADDVFRQDKVERVVAVFAAHPAAEWLMHPLRFVDGSLRLLDRPEPPARSGMCDVRAEIGRGRLGNRLGFEGTATSGLCLGRPLLTRILPMPPDRLLIDDYIKFAAMALAPGYVLDERLSLQRIHGANSMTLRPERAGAHLATLVATADWWRRRIPELKPFADNLFAMAAGTLGGLDRRDPALDRRIADYVGWSEPRRMINISLRRRYHWLRTKARRAWPR